MNLCTLDKKQLNWDDIEYDIDEIKEFYERIIRRSFTQKYGTGVYNTIRENIVSIKQEKDLTYEKNFSEELEKPKFYSFCKNVGYVKPSWEELIKLAYCMRVNIMSFFVGLLEIEEDPDDNTIYAFPKEFDNTQIIINEIPEKTSNILMPESLLDTLDNEVDKNKTSDFYSEYPLIKNYIKMYNDLKEEKDKLIILKNIVDYLST
jgi:hypothetical protein